MTTSPLSQIPGIQPRSSEHSVVAVYETHEAAEAAIKGLQASGFDMRHLSIVGKDLHTEEHAVGFYTAGDRMRFWGSNGAFWGSLLGMLVGSAFFFVPVVGPLVVMGPMVGWLVGALEGAAVGGTAGVLAAALTDLGIPKDSVVRYETELKFGRFLILARGTHSEIEQARGVLSTTRPSLLDAHPVPRPDLFAPQPV